MFVDAALGEIVQKKKVTNLQLGGRGGVGKEKG